ncbi:hypothetical protein JX265_011656 [Neoarthrinium moseri]|uniref:Uncharacterized protein n=1 Tax=Neoarthrinium moseri TaxID=1658444 RepID=A0A9P9WC59_9PEZI|nr:hypothetical protein JX265_011656 [Neoarthrinium moseri]
MLSNVSTTPHPVTDPVYRGALDAPCTATTDVAILGSNIVSALPRLSDSSTDVSGRVTITLPILNAIGVQVRYQSTDLAALGLASSTTSSIIQATTSSSSQTPSASGLSGGSIAGIVIGALAALALVIGASVYLFISKRRKAKNTQDITAEGFEEPENQFSRYNSASAPHRPFVKAELSGEAPTGAVFEKPELAGSEISNGVLSHRPGSACAVTRHDKAHGTRSAAELDSSLMPAELHGDPMRN